MADAQRQDEPGQDSSGASTGPPEAPVAEVAALEDLPEVQEAFLDDTTSSALVGTPPDAGEPDAVTPVFQEPAPPGG